MTDASPAPPPEAVAPPAVELHAGVPPLTTSPEGLMEAISALQAGTGPIAVDAERASGFRYGQRA